MEQQELEHCLRSQGFLILKNFVRQDLIRSIVNNEQNLIPDRGHGADNRYWPRDRVNLCPELALWWSQQISQWPEVADITDALVNKLGFLFEDTQVYVADVITNTPKNKFIKPHIDSPYRFDEWHESFDLLGVQCIVPLGEFTKDNGATGLLPGSHLKNWVVKDSYRGVYNQEFLDSMIQAEMTMGDVLVYHPRVLHSTMPNNTNQNRRALLVHLTSKEMVKKLKLVDNIWLG